MAQCLKIFLPNRQKRSCLDCKCGDKTLNNGRIRKTNICGWTWDIYWTCHCFNRCSYCGSRPRGRWRNRMRETQKLSEKRKKNYGCVYLDSRRSALSGPLLLYKEQQHQSLMRSSMTILSLFLVSNLQSNPPNSKKKKRVKHLKLTIIGL